MISHILFNLFSKYNIGSFGFRKVLAILITILIFGLLYITVRFTGIEIPNYTRNLVMLVSVDLAGFLFIMWKTPNEPLKEDINEEENNTENEAKKEIVQVNIETNTTKTLNKVAEKESESEIIIKKIEEVEAVEAINDS
jgi:hypothetical protein